MKRSSEKISDSNTTSSSSQQPNKDTTEAIEQKVAANEPPQKVKKQIHTPDMPETFGDPTYDVTFKMLFGNEQNKDILISLLNSLLGFTGNKEIEEVQINTNENPVSFFSDEKGESGIISAVDILCTNKGKHKIAIEMQGQKTKYFLAREQEYMAKLIANQVKEGEGKLYHEKVLETYIIVIGKDNMFVGSTKLRDQSLFELDAKVMITQTNEMYPGNKMYWKFFELPKFRQSHNYKYLSKNSSLKEQWLEFLIECSKQESEPDRNEIIKKGYEIMKIAKWNPDDKLLYQRQKQSEQKAKEAIEEAFEEGKLKGEIKGEICTIKTAIEWGKSKEEIMPKLKLLPKLSSEKFEECWQKISESASEAGYESDICDTLDLVGSIME